MCDGSAMKWTALSLVSALALIAACDRQQPARDLQSSARSAHRLSQSNDKRASSPRDESVQEVPSRQSGPRAVRFSPSGAVELVSGLAAGPGAVTIADEMVMATSAGRRCVVYVGATWCAPCKRFKRALLAGELDAILRGVRVLEFDADLDAKRLSGAGYTWQLVPYFSVPDAAGKNSGRDTAGVPSKDAPIAPLAKRIAGLFPTSPSTQPPRPLPPP